ncbi:hypothetical protein Esti_000719 [Eimeria stiedai]
MSLDDVVHPRFTYLLIPQDINSAVEELEFEGKEADFREHLKSHLNREKINSLNQKNFQQFKEGLKEKADGKIDEEGIERMVQGSSHNYQLSLLVLLLLAALPTAAVCWCLLIVTVIIPLTLPTKANAFKGINAYIDSVGRIKDLPTNARATRVCSTGRCTARVYMQLPDQSSENKKIERDLRSSSVFMEKNIRGDCFLSRVFDDEEVFQRVDIKKNDLEKLMENPPDAKGRWSETQAAMQLLQQTQASAQPQRILCYLSRGVISEKSSSCVSGVYAAPAKPKRPLSAALVVARVFTAAKSAREERQQPQSTRRGCHCCLLLQPTRQRHAAATPAAAAAHTAREAAAVKYKEKALEKINSATEGKQTPNSSSINSNSRKKASSSGSTRAAPHSSLREHNEPQRQLQTATAQSSSRQHPAAAAAECCDYPRAFCIWILARSMLIMKMAEAEQRGASLPAGCCWGPPSSASGFANPNMVKGKKREKGRTAPGTPSKRE